MHMVYKKYVCCCHAQVEVACKVRGDGYKSKWVLGDTTKAETMISGLVPKQRGELWYL